jgi:predicted N-acetyltransferase YhbS
MTLADLPLGLSLCREAGWNQTEADWRRFLALEPTGCFVAEAAGEPGGTVTTCVFGSVAWIAMVLVAERLRGQGVGTALLRHALAYLDARGVATVRLDATSLGQPLYERLGFLPEYRVTRWGGVPPVDQATTEVLPYGTEHLPGMTALDREATGTDRGKLLARLTEELPAATWCTLDQGEVTGYVVTRPGANAAQIGPCVARNEAEGRALLNQALAARAGEPVIVDVPADHAAATALVQAAGLTPQRDFVRMYRGEPVSDHVEMMWASSGPEMG